MPTLGAIRPRRRWGTQLRWPKWLEGCGATGHTQVLRLRASLRMTSKAEGKDNGEIRGFFAALRMTSSWVGVDKLPRYAG